MCVRVRVTDALLLLVLILDLQYVICLVSHFPARLQFHGQVLNIKWQHPQPSQ